MLFITVLVKKSYGVQTVYPHCKQSHLFAQLAGTKTITPHALRTIEQLGYTIYTVTEEVNIPGLRSPGLNGRSQDE
jgi:secreted Zn-dependent insulinase-like peptidase